MLAVVDQISPAGERPGGAAEVDVLGQRPSELDQLLGDGRRPDALFDGLRRHPREELELVFLLHEGSLSGKPPPRQWSVTERRAVLRWRHGRDDPTSPGVVSPLPAPSILLFERIFKFSNRAQSPVLPRFPAFLRSAGFDFLNGGAVTKIGHSG